MASVEYAARAPEGLVSELKLSVGKAVEIRDTVLAFSAGLKGVVAIADRTGMPLCLQVTDGDGLIGATFPSVLGKLKKVVDAHKSNRVQRETMAARGIRPLSSTGELLTDLDDGVAVFADKERQEFVGAVAYSGGLDDQGERMCIDAIEMAGLFTDIPPKVEEASS